VIELL
jgi:peroxin-5